jgi:tetratricopeptide (TPR) repeat protein
LIVFGTYGEEVATPDKIKFRLYLRQQPVMFAILSALLVVFFLFVTGLSRVYYAQRQALGNRWSNRGLDDLKSRNFAAAVTDFRTALLYSRDDFSYQLNLAEALVGMKKTGQAAAYLLNLWDRQPDNGIVNLELARIAALQGDVNQAIRYYHGAVYAAWPNDQESKRDDARLELVKLLLRINAKGQAQSELIALAENARENPAEQARIGELFLLAGDYAHALAVYQASLKSDPRNQAGLAGAGFAAFELARYPLAQRYLRAAVAGNPGDTESAERLNMTELVERMDPYRSHVSNGERARIVMAAFAAAGRRLASCAIPKSRRPGGGLSPSPSDSWAALKPKVTEEALRRNPELVDAALDLVFQTERQASVMCGAPTGIDEALLLIGKSHEGM